MRNYLRQKNGFKELTKNMGGGFTLFEVLVAVSILGIAIVIVLQLFSSNLSSISASGDYSNALIAAEAKMREIIDEQDLSEKSWSETTLEGYRFNISVSKEMKDRTDNLNYKLFKISLAVNWGNGSKGKSLVLMTTKAVPKGEI